MPAGLKSPAFVFLLTKAGGILYFDERNDEPMLFMMNRKLRELEQLMQCVPNFSPKGHGIVIIHSDEPPSKDRIERIKEGTATPKEVLTETLSTVTYPPFQRRLNQYIRESEMNPMDYRNEKHRAVFETTIRKKNKKDCALLSALYLLTADAILWQSVRRYIVDNSIRFNEIHLHGLNENSYTMFCAAKDLYLGTDCLTISDLADTSLVPPKVFGLICNAMAVRRFGLGAIHFTGGSK